MPEAQVTGIGLEPADSQRVEAWLTCDECVHGEREAATGTQNREGTVAYFSDVLRDRIPDLEANARRRYAASFRRIDDGTRDSAAYVNPLLENFSATLQERSAVALADLGAFDTLRNALDAHDAGSITYREDALEALRGAVLREAVATLGASSGGADVWVMVEPQTADSVCASDAPNCPPGFETVELAAMASGPSGVFANPFSTVYFYVESPVGGDVRRIGIAGSPTVTDDGTRRTYSWTFRWNGRDALPGEVLLYAVGLDGAGDPHPTPPKDDVTVLSGA